MLQATLWAGLGTGFTFLLTALGAATVFLFHKTMDERVQKVFFGFAAIEDARDQGLPGWLPAALGFILGGAGMIFLDWLAGRVRGRQARSRTSILFLAVTLHNIPEGMAVGLAFALAAREAGNAPLMASALTLALGIGIQNFPEGAALSLPIWQDGKTPARAFGLSAASGAVEPVFGVLAAVLGASVGLLMPWLLAFAAGAMMYVVVEEMLPEAASRSGTLGALFGFLVMMVLDVALG